MILCCGEALIDMIPRTLADGTACFVPCSGGAVFNTSIALGRLDAHVGMLTALSTDMFGQQLVTDLRASNVATGAILRSDHPSTLAFVQLVEGDASYAFFDAQSAESQLRPSDVPALPPETSALYFGGISLAREPSGDFYAALATGHGADLPIMIDPNIRKGFVQDEAAYRARLQRMMEVAKIVKVSHEDAAWLMPEAGSDAERRTYLGGGNDKIIVITRGGQGATAWLPDGTQVDVPAGRAEVVDTVGAGDTFNAGFLSALHEQGVLGPKALATLSADQLHQALTKAAKVAAITVSRVGANPPWATELA